VGLKDPDDDNPSRLRANRLFHEAYRKQMDGDLEGAAELYRKSIESFPTAEAYTFLGWTYSFMGRVDDAIAECHKAIATDPTFGNPYNDIGAYLLQKGQVDEAIPWFERALKAPRYESYCFPHMNLGRAYEAKKMWSAAMMEFEKALQERPEYTPARQGLVRIRAMFN
jgi:Tfp pilus assembly protein PilF